MPGKASDYLDSVEYGEGDGLVEIIIYGSRIKTIQQVETLNERALVRMYRYITGDTQPVLNPYPAVRVVMGQIDIDWHEIHGVKVSETMSDNQVKRVVKAKKQVADGEAAAADNGAQAAPKAPRKTIRQLITAMLLDSQPQEVITEAIRADFPGTKAAENPEQHTSYYRSKLVQEGKLEKQVRAPKAKAAGGEAQGDQVEVAVAEA